jgi:hypothetical protein
MCGPKDVNLNELEDVGAAVVIRSNITVLKTESAFLSLFASFTIEQ